MEKPELVHAYKQQGHLKAPRYIYQSERGKWVGVRASRRRKKEERQKQMIKQLPKSERAAARAADRAAKTRQKEAQAVADERKKRLRAERMALGLTAMEGFVKPSTKVLQNQPIKNGIFRESALFCKPQFACLTSVPMKLIEDLKVLEDKLLSNLRADGALEGDTVTIDVGGVRIIPESDDGIAGGESGSIHCARVLEGDPHTRQLLYECVRRIMRSAFGNDKWYQALVMLTERLNQESEEERTIPGLPFSALRLTQNPDEETIQVDENAVGATVVLTTSHFKGTELRVINDNKKMRKLTLVAGDVLAGRWAQNPHQHRKVLPEFCTSWTFSLDCRVFFRNYVCVDLN